MSIVAQLVQEVAVARERYLAALGTPTAAQAAFKSAPDAWSLVEITEHITLAEQGGICSIWKALDGYRRGQPAWSGEPPHRGRSIEEIVAATWREREEAPAVAAPRWGGPAAYWAAALRACQPLLDALAGTLADDELEVVLYPHPISGPLDARQRLEFLRFHLDRHTAQLERVKAHPDFPGGESVA